MIRVLFLFLLFSFQVLLAHNSHKISSKGVQDGASDLFSPRREHYQRDKESPGRKKGDVADCADLPRGCENCGLARISHKISSKGAQDGASDLFSPRREHYQRDKESPGEKKGDVADCADLPRGYEKCGLTQEALIIEGYLGQDQVIELQDRLKAFTEKELYLVVRSNGGGFFEVLRLAQTIESQKQGGSKVIMLLDKRAIGPAAFLPFLADALYITPGSVWGNIPYGVDNSIPRDIMMDAARGLVPVGKQQIAEAMIDPYSQVSGMSFSSDPLLLSTDQIIALGYGKEVLSKQAFFHKFSLDHSASQMETISLDQIKGVVSQQAFTASLETHVRFDPKEENYVGYIKFDAPITEASYLETKFAIEHFQTSNAKLIILDLNVTKGDIFSAIKIADFLEKTDANKGIPCLAYLNEQALGAGALIALSCRYIIGGNSAAIGASDKVRFNKLYAALSPEFGKAASFWGRNNDIAKAMVDRSYTLVLRNHEIVSLKSPSDIRTSMPDPDVLITKKGELLTLHGKEIYDVGISSDILNASSSLTKKEYKKGSWPAEKSAVFSIPYLQNAKDVTMLSYGGWSVSFFAVLTSSLTLALLFFGLLVGFYLELNTPGFGIMGTIGLICFALIIWGNATLHSINWIQWSVLAIGLLFFAVELFFIPGFGWMGITGILFILLALASFSLPNTGTLDLLQWDGFVLVLQYVFPQLLAIAGGLISGVVFIYIVAKFFSHRVLKLSELSLHGMPSKAEAYTTLHPDIIMPEIGSLGVAFTPLKPSGKVRIGDDVYEAVTQTGFIDQEALVTVVRVDGYRVIVRLMSEEE